MNNLLTELKDRISSEFQILKNYSIESDQLIKTLYSAEEDMLKQYSNYSELLKQGEVFLMPNNFGRPIEVNKIIAETTTSILQNKLSTTQKYKNILNISVGSPRFRPQELEL